MFELAELARNALERVSIVLLCLLVLQIYNIPLKTTNHAGQLMV